MATDHGRIPVHPALRNALLSIAGRGGGIDVRVLGQWLGVRKDRIVNLGEDDAPDRVALEHCGVLHGSQQWKVVNRESAT